MNWFRLYHDWLDDQKVLQLSPCLQLFLVKLWCVSSKQDVRGTLPNLRAIAKLTRTPNAKAARHVGQLIAAGFIDENDITKELTIHGWEERQYESDDVTARTKRHREKKRERSRNVPGNGMGTLTETDTETDTERIPPPHAHAREGNPTGEEPFHADPGEVQPTPHDNPPKPVNDPAEVARVAAIAESLYPMLEFGRRAELAAKVFPVPLIEEALIRKQGQTQSWSYVLGTIKGLVRDGWKPEPAIARAPPSIPVPTPMAKPESRQQAFLRRQREKLEQMDREDREAEEAGCAR